jgi:hypothetical protein
VTQFITRIHRGTSSLRERMATPRRIQITIETHQVFIIRRHPSTRLWCQGCGHEAEMLDLGDVQATTGLPHQALLDAAGTHGFHVSQDCDGSTLICLEGMRRQ